MARRTVSILVYLGLLKLGVHVYQNHFETKKALLSVTLKIELTDARSYEVHISNSGKLDYFCKSTKELLFIGTASTRAWLAPVSNCAQ